VKQLVKFLDGCQGNIKILRIFIKLIQLRLPLIHLGHFLWKFMENLRAMASLEQ